VQNIFNACQMVLRTDILRHNLVRLTRMVTHDVELLYVWRWKICQEFHTSR
jgi:hypothetical protein